MIPSLVRGVDVLDLLSLGDDRHVIHDGFREDRRFGQEAELLQDRRSFELLFLFHCIFGFIIFYASKNQIFSSQALGTLAFANQESNRRTTT